MASPTRFIDYAAIAPAVQQLLGQFVLHSQVEDPTSHISSCCSAHRQPPPTPPKRVP